MRNLLAVSVPIGDPLKGIGPFGLEGKDANTSALTFQTILSNMIGIITIIGIIWFVFLVITGAIGIMSAGGDKQAIESSRKKLTNGLIGLVILIAAIFILNIVGTLLGIPNILWLSQLINQVSIQ